MFRWGIMGLGKIAHKFASDMKFVPEGRVHAVASRSQTKAQEFGARYGVEHCFGSYDELLDLDQLDAIYVATPHSIHFELASRCLERKVPVLCEKPLAINAREVENLIRISRSQGAFLMEGLWTRFHPHLLKVLEIIESGQIGDIHSVWADFGVKMNFDPDGRIFNRKLAGGALLDLGVYPVFLARLLLGPVSEIKTLGQIGPTGVDEQVSMALKHEGGSLSHLYCSVLNQTPCEARIYGEKGCIRMGGRWHEPNSVIYLQVDGEKEQVFEFSSQGSGLEYEIREVIRCVRGGHIQSNLHPHQFSLEVTQTLDEVRRQLGLVYPQESQQIT